MCGWESLKSLLHNCHVACSKNNANVGTCETSEGFQFIGISIIWHISIFLPNFCNNQKNCMLDNMRLFDRSKILQIHCASLVLFHISSVTSCSSSLSRDLLKLSECPMSLTFKEVQKYERKENWQTDKLLTDVSSIYLRVITVKLRPWFFNSVFF